MVLITGGTGGVGLAVARRLDSLGARVIIGSRDPARYERAAAELGPRTRPFIADVGDAEGAAEALERLVRQGVTPTDVIHSAAGGMEPVMVDLVRVMAGLRRRSGADLDRAHAAAREEMAGLVEGTRDLAANVNFAGPAALLGRLAPTLPEGGTVTFYSSLWATHFPHRQVPVYYGVVAESKQALERWLVEQAETWQERQITTAVISANLIMGTRMGYLLDRFCTDLMPPGDRDRWRATYVTFDDLIGATIDVLGGSRPDRNGGLVRRYLPLPGLVRDDMSPDDSPMDQAVPLAQNAPRWGS